MADSSPIGARFEKATLELFKHVFPLLGFEVIHQEPRRSGSQTGFDILFQTRPLAAGAITVNFFIECKGAGSINLLPLSEFEAKPELLDSSLYDPDYWILLSPLRYLGNDFQELLQRWKRRYPFAFVTWVREGKDKDKAGLHLDLYKHFPAAYDIFKEDVPEEIRDTAPEHTLDEILSHLKNSISNAYDEFQERVVRKGVVPGARRITPQAVYRSKEGDDARLAKIRTGYYMLNSTDRFVWRAVCNELDVRNAVLGDEIKAFIGGVKEPINTAWVLGAPGCGKTTQMYRTAADLSLGGHPVLLINASDLSEDTALTEYEEYFRLIYHLHSTAAGDRARPLLVLIDNPAAKVETVVRILSRFDGLDEDFNCVFLLFEREVRYREAEDEDFLIDLIAKGTSKIFINSRDAAFKENVCQAFGRALELPPAEVALARDAFLGDPQISVAEAVINFCKRTHNEGYKRIVMDWVDFEELTRQQRWDSLTDLYKWVSLLYQFGIAMPASLLRRVLPQFDENEFLNFQDFFNEEEYENLPLIMEGQTLRTRHELIAQWHAEEKLRQTAPQRLAAVLEAADIHDALERSIFISLTGRKSIVRRYFARLDERQFEDIRQKGEEHPASRRIAMMATGWALYFKGELLNARDVFKEVLYEHPNFLPAILEAGKMEFLLGDMVEAERLLQSLLVVDPQNLHARTELAKVYQAQGKYDEAERVLDECIKLSPDDLKSRNELGKVYQAQRRYAEAERILKWCIKFAPQDLNSRTELAKVYQAQKKDDEAVRTLNDLLALDTKNLQARTELGRIFRFKQKYDEAEKHLAECIRLSPNDLNSRTELAKVYQEQGRYDEAEKVLKECIKISPRDLNSRTELAKVYQEQGRYDEAEKVLKEALDIDSKQLHPRTELARVYQAQGRYDEAERVLDESLAIDPKQLHPRTELAKVYQAQGRYDEAEKIVNESLNIDFNQIHPRTERARNYISQGQFRKARAEVLWYVQLYYDINNKFIAHLILAYLNACYRMRRYQDGVNFIDKFGCQFISSVVAEEYGRLLRADNLSSAVMFFQTALRIFNNAGRLLSEAAICFKLAGRIDAEDMLELAIRLQPDKEVKYREIYNNPTVLKTMGFKVTDCNGFVVNIDYEKMDGVIESKYATYSFHWDKRFDSLFRTMKINDEVLFDVTDRGYATNVEPIF